MKRHAGTGVQTVLCMWKFSVHLSFSISVSLSSFSLKAVQSFIHEAPGPVAKLSVLFM